MRRGDPRHGRGPPGPVRALRARSDAGGGDRAPPGGRRAEGRRGLPGRHLPVRPPEGAHVAGVGLDGAHPQRPGDGQRAHRGGDGHRGGRSGAAEAHHPQPAAGHARGGAVLRPAVRGADAAVRGARRRRRGRARPGHRVLPGTFPRVALCLGLGRPGRARRSRSLFHEISGGGAGGDRHRDPPGHRRRPYGAVPPPRRLHLVAPRRLHRRPRRR